MNRIPRQYPNIPSWLAHLTYSSLLVMLFILLSISSCRSIISDDPQFTPTAQEIPPPKKQTATSTPQIELLPSPSESYWIDPRFPAELKSLIASSLSQENISQRADADILITSEAGLQIGSWYYAVVSPFPSLNDDIPLSTLQAYWGGEKAELPRSGKLFMSEETKNSLTLLWGSPSPNRIQVLEGKSLLDSLWPRPYSVAIIPLPDLEPRWKVLTVDNIHPLLTDSLATYPLFLPISLHIQQGTIKNLPTGITNFDPEELTTLAMTGVTALVRDTAALMEANGIEYPARDVGPILKQADLTHISNEVPFAEDCPEPDPNQESLYFCSQDEYILLLETVGADIIELSGDHFGDWGSEAMLHTLSLYDERGWKRYGGGENLQAGLDPIFINHHGNRIAFIGCNAKEGYATATENEPGASKCNFDWMATKISQLVENGYIVIATMQHEEIDSFSPVALQIWDFHRLADAGAAIISGSQAHHPQTMEFYQASFVHYGLGNLFFDQYYLSKYNPKQHLNKDKAFIDLHSIYHNKHINTHLIPIQFMDNARPRPMTTDEANQFLSDVFSAAVWLNNFSTDTILSELESSKITPTAND